MAHELRTATNIHPWHDASMMIHRRTLLTGLSATLLTARMGRIARAAGVTDDAGRTVVIPDKVERIFAAGHPAAILLFSFAPELLLGWRRKPDPAQCGFLGSGACDNQEVGRLTGRGNTTDLETLLQAEARFDPRRRNECINITYVSLANQAQEQAGILALLTIAQRLLDAWCRKSTVELGALTHREAQAEDFAQYAERTIATVKSRIDRIPDAQRPRVYYGRGAERT